MSAEYANITLLLQQILDLLADDADDYDYYVDDDMDADCEDDSADDEENSAPAAVVVGVNYKRWGRTECPENATLVYAGIHTLEFLELIMITVFCCSHYSAQSATISTHELVCNFMPS